MYYKEVLQDFIATGRVMYFPECHVDIESCTFQSLTDTNLRYKVYAKTIVNATYTNVQVPSMRPPPFEIKKSMNCIVGNVNETPKLVQTHPNADFVVIGAGKTGVDAILELLKLGISSSHIMWVISKDAWYIIREIFAANVILDRYGEFYNKYIEANCNEKAFLELEQGPHPKVARLDPDIIPKVFKAATISLSDIPKLRTISQTIRLGRIIRIENDTMILEKGNVSYPKRRLFD